MNLLFVTDVFPCPPHSGSAVISFHWIRSLVARHNVRLVSAMPPESHRARREVEEIGVSLFGCKAPLVRPRGVQHAVSWTPMAMHRVRARELLADVENAVDMSPTDAVVVVGAALGTLLPRLRRMPPVVFVPYDAESLNFQMRARHARGIARRAYFRIETMKWRRVEARYYPLASVCVAVTEEDAKAISRGWAAPDRARIRVIPNGVDVTHFSPWPIAEVPDRLVISGNLQAVDTEVSIRWFVSAVLPRIRDRIPTATVEIVGRDPLPSLRSLLAEVEGAKLVGYVPDLRPHLAQASVYVAPLRLGSGVKNRVLEAMAMGRAVVATPLGIRGIQVLPGRDVLIAATEDGFAQTVVDVLKDQERRYQLGMAAREAVLARHTWPLVGDHVEEVLSCLGCAH